MGHVLKVAKVEKVKTSKKEPQKAFSLKAKPTPMMKAAKISWIDLQAIGEHCINLLEEDGETAIDLVKITLHMAEAVSERDYAAVFADLNAARIDLQKIITDIKVEFGITD